MEKRTLGTLLVDIFGHLHVIRLLLLLLLFLRCLFRRRHDRARWRVPLRLPRRCLDVIVSVGRDVEMCCPSWRHGGRVRHGGFRGFLEKQRVNPGSRCMFGIFLPSIFFSPSSFFSLSLPPNCFFSTFTISLKILDDMVTDDQ